MSVVTAPDTGSTARIERAMEMLFAA